MNATPDPEGPQDLDATVIRPTAPAVLAAAAAPAPVDRHEGGNALPVGSRQAEFEITRVLGKVASASSTSRVTMRWSGWWR